MCFVVSIKHTGSESDGTEPKRKKEPEAGDSTTRLISYLTEKNKEEMSLRREELKLEKEKFEASRDEHQGTLDVMKAMLAKMK